MQSRSAASAPSSSRSSRRRPRGGGPPRPAPDRPAPYRARAGGPRSRRRPRWRDRATSGRRARTTSAARCAPPRRAPRRAAGWSCPGGGTPRRRNLVQRGGEGIDLQRTGRRCAPGGAPNTIATAARTSSGCASPQSTEICRRRPGPAPSVRRAETAGRVPFPRGWGASGEHQMPRFEGDAELSVRRLRGGHAALTPARSMISVAARSCPRRLRSSATASACAARATRPPGARSSPARAPGP